jgi:hypothetical protein
LQDWPEQDKKKKVTNGEKISEPEKVGLLGFQHSGHFFTFFKDE